MSALPVYLWLITFAGVFGVVAMTCVVLYQGGSRAGLSRKRNILSASTAAVLLGGWFTFSTFFAASGGYHVRNGGQQWPWLAVAVLAFLIGLLALTLVPTVRKSLNTPEMASSLMKPHGFRVVGIVFLTAWALGYLPAVFAIPAGVGDIAVSIAAPFVARKLANGAGRHAVLWFNAFGITDLVLALTLGALASYGFFPGIMPIRAITELPLVLIPTVAVPILLVLHILSLVSLIRQKAATAKVRTSP